MKEKIFNVPNITCQHCVHTIKMELSELQGVQSVNPDAVSKDVKVIFNEPASEQAIIDLLEEINYPAKS
jgi:copper chaperone CopZ